MAGRIRAHRVCPYLVHVRTLAMAHMTRGVVGKGRERAAAAAGAGALPHMRRVVRAVPPLGVRTLPLPLPLPCSRAQLAVLCAVCPIRCEAG